jgi:high mobility group protein B2
MKEMGSRWGKLSAQEKLPFEELAKKDKERYNQEMLQYNASKNDD